VIQDRKHLPGRFLLGLIFATCLWVNLGSAMGCVSQPHRIPDGWAQLPGVDLSASVSADQRSTIAKQGPPTTRWRTRLWTERWVYCLGARVVRVLEFDSQGVFLSEANRGNPLLCEEGVVPILEPERGARL